MSAKVRDSCRVGGARGGDILCQLSTGRDGDGAVKVVPISYSPFRLKFLSLSLVAPLKPRTLLEPHSDLHQTITNKHQNVRTPSRPTPSIERSIHPAIRVSPVSTSRGRDRLRTPSCTSSSWRRNLTIPPEHQSSPRPSWPTTLPTPATHPTTSSCGRTNSRSCRYCH